MGHDAPSFGQVRLCHGCWKELCRLRKELVVEVKNNAVAKVMQNTKNKGIAWQKIVNSRAGATRQSNGRLSRKGTASALRARVAALAFAGPGKHEDVDTITRGVFSIAPTSSVDEG